MPVDSASPATGSDPGAFDALLAPVSLATLKEQLLEGRLRHYPASDPQRFTALLDWPQLRRLLGSGDYPSDRLRVTSAAKAVPKFLYLDNGSLSEDKLDSTLAHGASLIAGGVDRHVPVLDALCRAAGARVAEAIKVGAIVTQGKGGALALHFDPQDLLIMQVAGSKRWLIHADPVVNPVHGMGLEPPAGAPAMDLVLQPGDMLFLPRGHWHRCENGPELSLHLGLFFDPPNAARSVREQLDRLLADEQFRAPLSRFTTAQDREDHEARLRARLVEAARTMDFSQGALPEKG